MNILWMLVCIVLAYVIGSIPTGWIVARAYGINIRQQGSGNIGATNVLRSVGKLPAAIVVLADPLKALLTVIIAQRLSDNPWFICATALAAILGNSFSLFLRFRGGKGVATSFGAFTPIDGVTTLFAFLLAAFGMYLGRMVSLAVLIAIFASIFFHYLSGFHPASLILVICICLLSIYNHRTNIERLKLGTESRLGGSAKSE